MDTEKLREITPYALNTLTLERNTVLVARVSKKSGYDFEELSVLRNKLKEIFPLHQVFVWYDDIEFIAIHDNSYPPEKMSLVNNDNPYGY